MDSWKVTTTILYMNCRDAARYTRDLSARVAIPTHWGLFKKFENDPNTPQLFAAEAEALGVKAHILQIYETIDTQMLLDQQ